MRSLSIVATGDLILDVPDADHWLGAIAPLLRSADLAIGHLEVPHGTSVTEMAGDVPAPAAPPENVAAIARAGFGAVTPGRQPHRRLRRRGHRRDAGAARRGTASAIAALGSMPPRPSRRCSSKCGGRRIGLLSYNCVGPEAAWAQPGRAGCAWLRIATSDGSAIAPAAPLAIVTEEALGSAGERHRRAAAGRRYRAGLAAQGPRPHPRAARAL